MPRLFRLAIAMLPLALGAAVAGAQEPRRAGPEAGPRQSGREVGMRESLVQRRRNAAPDIRQAMDARPTVRAEAPAPANHSMSDAVRRVQRSTGGQILGAEQVPFEGRSITRVKYMDDRGRVRYMDYTDESGARERRPPRRADNGER